MAVGYCGIGLVGDYLDAVNGRVGFRPCVAVRVFTRHLQPRALCWLVADAQRMSKCWLDSRERLTF
jgi:hypothetical protein